MKKVIIILVLLFCTALVLAVTNPYRLYSSFNAGELSELLSAREGLSKFQSGCSQMENVLVIPQGGAEKRPGTKYVGTLVTSSSEQYRLFPFEYSVTDSYIIAVSDANIYFYYSE